jgi:hypothetical protein
VIPTPSSISVAHSGQLNGAEIVTFPIHCVTFWRYCAIEVPIRRKCYTECGETTRKKGPGSSVSLLIQFAKLIGRTPMGSEQLLQDAVGRLKLNCSVDTLEKMSPEVYIGLCRRVGMSTHLLRTLRSISVAMRRSLPTPPPSAAESQAACGKLKLRLRLAGPAQTIGLWRLYIIDIGGGNAQTIGLCMAYVIRVSGWQAVRVSGCQRAMLSGLHKP